MNPERKKNEVLKGEIIERKTGWYWSGKVESKKANKAAVRGHADQPVRRRLPRVEAATKKIEYIPTQLHFIIFVLKRIERRNKYMVYLCGLYVYS